jgi:hypothetical protein
MRFFKEELIEALVEASMSGEAWARRWKNWIRPPIARVSNFCALKSAYLRCTSLMICKAITWVTCMAVLPPPEDSVKSHQSSHNMAAF